MIRSLLPWLLLIFLIACEEPDIVSSEVIPGTDQPGVVFSDTTSLLVSTVREDSLISSNATLPLFLGSLYDQVIGVSSGSVYIQMRLNSVPFTGFEGYTVPDSVVLTLGYIANYGDTAATHNVSVYRMEEMIYPDTVYYTARDFAVSSLLGSGTIIPNLKDSLVIDSVKQAPHLRIRLDDSFGATLMNDYVSNSGNFSSHESFYQYFKGIYIKDTVNYSGAGDVQGSMLTIDPGSVYNTVTVYYGSGQSRVFTLNASSGRSVRFRHLYNNAVFTDQSQYIVQSMSGLKTKIELPYIKQYIQNRKISVNKAEVVVSLKGGTTSVMPNHSSMIIFAADSVGKNTLITDFFETSNYVGGVFDGTNYKFNISRHLQRILNGDINNYGFYLVGNGSVSNANRTVLNGAGSVKFNLTYTIQNN